MRWHQALIRVGVSITAAGGALAAPPTAAGGALAVPPTAADGALAAPAPAAASVGAAPAAPAPTPAAPGAAGWVAADAGSLHTCALRADRTLWCWGRNDGGQLGDGTRTDRPTPVPVGGTAGWRLVTVGSAHTCATRVDGRLLCWGANEFGQAGTVDPAARTVPTPVAARERWREVSTEANHTCGIRIDGTLWCWGSNLSGQLGDGTRVSSLDTADPVRFGAPVLRWVTLSAGSLRSCAIATDRSLWCWGTNESGQLGDGSTTARYRPVPVAAGFRWVAVSASYARTCGIRVDGTLWCWGGGQSTPARLAAGAWAAVAVAVPAGTVSHELCAIRADGTLWCGYTTIGLAQVGAGTGWAGLTAGVSYSCATRVDGSLWCWGGNRQGELGSAAVRWSPVPLRAGSGAAWASVTAGAEASCGLRHDRTLWCWGAVPGAPTLRTVLRPVHLP